MRQATQPIYIRSASLPVTARPPATLASAVSARLRDEPRGKAKPAPTSVNLGPIALAAIAVLGGLAIAGFLVTRSSTPEPYVLPANVSTVNPGDTRWFQQMNGKFHQWTVDKSGTYHYVGPVEAIGDPSLEGMKFGSGADLAKARREALKNTLTEQ